MPIFLLTALLSTATAITSAAFVLGLFIEHEHIRRNLHRIIQEDPYAFYIRTKLFTIFDTSKPHAQTPETTAPTRMEEIMKYGFPGLDDIRLYSDFVLSYDRRNRVAHWVFEHLRARCLGNYFGVNRKLADFLSDHNVPILFRSQRTDYWNSGYTRGHLAAAGNHKCHQTHCNDTFFLTNIAPQIGRGFNWDAWNRLEQYVRQLTERYGSVYCCTGPLYLPKYREDGKAYIEFQLIGTNKVAVPTHFFKVIIVESQLKDGKPYMEAYVMPNEAIDDNVNLRTFLWQPELVEKASGLNFFDGIPRDQLHGINFRSNHELFSTFR